MVLGLLWLSTAHAIPKWIGNPVKVCKINQDIDLSLVWLEEGKVEEKEDFSLKKGDYITLNKRTNKDQKWYVTPNNVFPSKDKPKWHKLEVRGRSEKVKKKDFIVDCKKIDYKKIDYKSYTAASFNEIFNNKYKYYGSNVVNDIHSPPNFRTELGLKDITQMIDSAANLGVPMPLGELLQGQISQTIDAGDRDLDWSAMARVAARAAGLEVK